MPSLVSTGQLNLDSLKKYLLRSNPESLSGSKDNITGFYPYTGNPAEFAHTGYVDSVSGDISGYIDTVSGVVDSRLVASGTDLSGFTAYVSGNLKSDITHISGLVDTANTSITSANNLALTNQSNITALDARVVESGTNLSGFSSYISGNLKADITTVSGLIDTKDANLNNQLRAHVEEDYLSKRKNESELVSGDITFAKKTRFQQSIELERVIDHDEIPTYQSGVNMYSMITGDTVNGQAYQVMTSYLRYPHNGNASTNQNIIVGSFMYCGDIP